MSGVLIAAMPGETTPARRLAALLDAPSVDIDVHRFPDRESRVRAGRAQATTILYCSLNDPNAKLIELALAASALRDLGARRLVLVAPYLCYMRQDAAFQPGEAVSQRVVGRFLAERFDRIVTIEPHLHRARTLAEVFPGAETTSLSAAPLLAEIIRRDGAEDRAIVVGPDAESRRWTEAVAAAIGAPFHILRKARRDDRQVSIETGEGAAPGGRTAYLIDDVASTGNTLATAAKLLFENGAKRVEAVVAHALSSDADVKRLRAAGIARLRSTDSVAHVTNAIEVAPLLAAALCVEAP
jgi:ribose-phosphate pyrophosphokinase